MNLESGTQFPATDELFVNAEMQVLYKVANSTVRTFPYPHIRVENVFPAEFYQQIRQHLPPTEAYKSLSELGRIKGQYDARRVLLLTPDSVSGLKDNCREFWDNFSRWLLGGPFSRIALHKFSPYLSSRFENLASMQFDQEAMVIQDRTTYALGPHTDSPSKVLSFIFYLPADDSTPHLGTSIYLPADPTFTCAGDKHWKPPGFNRLVTMPYVPNTLFAFMKTPRSFHGVEPIKDEGIERALLLYDIKVGQP